jgi:type IX secretion system PorP/SprF family membrane protein
MKTKLSTLAILFLSAQLCFGQDMHFSQFNEVPMQLNPALTGAVNSTRASLHYKDQWRSVTVPYKTIGASYEMRFNTNEWEKVPTRTEIYKLAQKRIAGGVSFFSDKAGDGNMGLTEIQFSLSSSAPLTAQSVLVAGLQGGFAQRSVNYSKLVFPEQYTGTGYDANMATGENFSANVFYYGDFSGGLAWIYKRDESKIKSNDGLKCVLGGAVFHFNAPGHSFLNEGSEKIYRRYMGHMLLDKGIRNSNVSLVPSFIAAFQGPTHELIGGLMVKYRLGEDSKYTGYIKGANVLLGAYYRSQDAVIPTLMLEFGRCGIGLSYDLNFSNLTTATQSRGGFEVMIKFVTPNPFIYQNSNPRFGK